MNKEQIKKRIEELKSNINKHNYKYYILAEPVITDEQYDKLYRELLSLEMQYPEFLSSDSPTQKVGGEPLRGFKSIKHPIPMLSLDNTYSFNELRNFDKRVKSLMSADIDIEYSIEPKIDGVAVRIVYDEGLFFLGASRGNGTIGDDITENIKTIKRLPLRLIDAGEDLKNIDIRGEVFLRKDTFLEINMKREEAGDKLFANTRNAAAGSLKLLNPKEVAKRNLDIFIHSFSGQLFGKFITYSQTLRKLGKLGLPIIEHRKIITGIDNVIEYIDEWDKIRDNQNYITDGMVIKVNKLEYCKILGSTAKSPRWAIAYKFKAKQAETILKDVIFQVGRTGVITPVSILEPISLAGSVISRTTLHNEDEIKRLGIKIGDKVVVEKGGDVIPKIIKYDSDSRNGSEKDIKFPNKCP
ncbi:DNA ligase (NAD(+)) LigA, partial [candidate division TA06 bacterium]